jgi:hypothetical protein
MMNNNYHQHWHICEGEDVGIDLNQFGEEKEVRRR